MRLWCEGRARSRGRSMSLRHAQRRWCQPPIAWPERVLHIFRLAGVSADHYEPLILMLKLDGWARDDKKGLSRLPRPLPGEADGNPRLLVGLHGTTEGGLRGILISGQLQRGPASYRDYVFIKGYLAYEGAHRANDEEARRVLKGIRDKGSKHACGVIIEVCM